MAEVPTEPTGADWQHFLAQARDAFLLGCGRRLAAMTTVLERLGKRPGDAATRDELRRGFHSFAGSGATYGFPRVTTLGRQGEIACESAATGGRPVDAATIEEWRSLLDGIRAALEAGSPTPTSPSSVRRSSDSPSGRRVLVVDDDEEIVRVVRQLLEADGHEVVEAGSRAEALSRLDPLPHGAIVDVRLPDGDGYDLVERIRELPRGDQVAVLMISVLTGFIDKVEAIHCGSDAYMEKPLDLPAVARRLEHLLSRGDTRPPRILAVEDDPAQAAFLRTVMESAGYQVDVCEDPIRFESQLLAFTPDLVLMDVLLPAVSGFDLARLMKQDERHVALPVVFLTTEHSSADLVEGARAGGDAYLEKPVEPSLLISTVAARIERARLLESLLNRDGLTRLLTHTAFVERAREAYALASREPTRQVAWVMIDLDHFKEVNDRHGHPVGDRVLASLAAMLRRRFRQTDTLGRYGGEEFALLLHDLSAEQAEALVRRLLEDFAALDHVGDDGSVFRVTFSAGVAPLHSEGTGFASWRRQADEALYAAKLGGRSQVRVHATARGGPLTPRVGPGT